MRYLALIALLFAGAASAADYPVSWTNPTQYVNGEPLAISDLAEIRAYCDGVFTQSLNPADFAGTTLAVSGRKTCYITAVVISGEESDPSNSVEIKPGKPNPPGQFQWVR